MTSYKKKATNFTTEDDNVMTTKEDQGGPRKKLPEPPEQGRHAFSVKHEIVNIFSFAVPVTATLLFRKQPWITRDKRYVPVCTGVCTNKTL